MNEARIQLIQLLKKNNISVDESLRTVFVEKVKLNIKENIIEIILTSKEIVAEEILYRITNIFENKFDGLSVLVNIKYDILEDLDKTISKLWNNILYCIEKEIPSSRSWVQLLEYEIENLL